MSARTALYRHFDAAGHLLYVGISLSAVQRLAQHRDRAVWFDQIAWVTIEWLPTRGAALEAERSAISEEKPIWNVVRPMAGKRRTSCGRTWAIEHVPTTRKDGNYFSQDDADEMLAWWRALYPGEIFRLDSRPAGHIGGATGYAGILRVETMGNWKWGGK